MNLEQLDRKFVGRESPAEELSVSRTERNVVIDARGKKYIDFVAGWCVGNAGWGNAEIRKRVNGFRGPDYVYPEYLYRPWAELAQLLAKITPGNLRRSYRATGGSEAVDIALQLATESTGRRRFVSVEGSYHGNTIGTLLRTARKIRPPLDENAADRLEAILRTREVAAFIMEPVSCSLNVLVPEEEFMKRVSRMCRRYGTLLIMDEVACGFGRTGALFATEHFGISPDILCMGKAVTGGYAPMGATITTEKVSKSVEGEVGFWSTYGWHPRSVEAAIANVRWWIRNRRAMLEHVEVIADLFRERLWAMNFKRKVPSIRVKGLAIAVDTGDEKYAHRISERCRKKGLLVTTAEGALTIFPPLTIDRKTADRGLDILEGCLK